MPRIKRARSIPGGGGRAKKSRSSGARPSRLRISRVNITRASVFAVCGCDGQILVNNTNGFSSQGNSIQFTFTQNGVYASVGNNAFALWGGSVFANALAYAAIYDEFRILKVQAEILWNTNEAGISAGATLSLPIMYAVIDYDDGAPLSSSDQALGYSTCKVMQMGNSNSNGGKQYMTIFKPACQGSVLQTNNTTTAGQVIRGPWINSAANACEQNGLKIWYNNQTGTATTIGYLTIVFRVFYEYRNVH